MRRLGTTVVTAAILAASSAIGLSPASAAPVAVRIETADLDLGSPAGRQALEKRLDGAIARICTPEPQLELVAACNRAVREEAAGQMDHVRAVQAASRAAATPLEVAYRK